MTKLEFYRLLDELGLPHQEPLTKLKKKFGPGKLEDFYMVNLPDSKKILPSQILPFSYQDSDLSPDLLPTDEFSTELSLEGDFQKSHRDIVTELSAKYGQAEDTSVSNTYEHHWNFGRAMLEVTTWHSSKKPSRTLKLFPAHFLPALPSELMAFQKLQPIQGAHSKPLIDFMEVRKNGTQRGIFRELLFSKKEPQVGIDEQFLLGQHNDFGFIIPREQITNVRLDQVEKARGNAYSTINVFYSDKLSSSNIGRMLCIFQGSEANSLDEIAALVASKLKLKLKIENYCND
jgi:hypothetical protein